MNAREQQARIDAPNSAAENFAGSAACKHAADVVIKAHFGDLENSLASICAFHIQRLDEMQQKHPEFYDSQEVALREVAREIIMRKITS